MRNSNQSLSMREKTYRLLRKQLLAGKFNPSQRLTEEYLAKTLGVSRTPVREALHKLELEGLVKMAGARGFCVPEDSIEDKNELFEIRAILEGHALACLCKNISKENIESLSELICSAENALSTSDLKKVFEFNTQFHDLLYRLIGQSKPRLFNLIEDMREYVLRYRRNTLINSEAAARSISGHKKILMALELGDPQLCDSIMRNHVCEAEEDTIVMQS